MTDLTPQPSDFYAAARAPAAPRRAPLHPATMRLLFRRTLIVALILLPAIGLTFWLLASRTPAVWMADVARRAIPPVITVGPTTWTSVELKLHDYELAILQTRDYVCRSYTHGSGPAVILVAVFSEDNRKGTHPPDVCLEGGGSQIEQHSSRRVTVANGMQLPVHELVVNDRGSYQYFCYFYKCGDSFTPSFYVQQVRILWDSLLGHDAGGALIRYSTPMADANDLPAARARVDNVIRGTFPSIRDRLTVE